MIQIVSGKQQHLLSLKTFLLTLHYQICCIIGGIKKKKPHMSDKKWINLLSKKKNYFYDTEVLPFQSDLLHHGMKSKFTQLIYLLYSNPVNN